MTEFSMLWENVRGIGDGAYTYDQEQAVNFYGYFTGSGDSQGVLAGIDNELEVSGTSSPLAVATGKASVYGFRYWNTSSVNVTVATPGSNTGGAVVLRADWSANTA